VIKTTGAGSAMGLRALSSTATLVAWGAAGVAWGVCSAVVVVVVVVAVAATTGSMALASRFQSHAAAGKAAKAAKDVAIRSVFMAGLLLISTTFYHAFGRPERFAVITKP
jgi:hypothetical protein